MIKVENGYCEIEVDGDNPDEFIDEFFAVVVECRRLIENTEDETLKYSALNQIVGEISMILTMTSEEFLDIYKTDIDTTKMN